MKKVILFGTGMYGKTFVEKNKCFMHDNFLFCDNDSDRLDETIQGLGVISFCECEKLYKLNKIERIIITTARVEEVFEQCIQGGIDDKDIYYYDITTNAIKIGREMYSFAVCSQDGEEAFLREFFGSKKNGFYVDVGAYNPFRFSNTAWAYERGWTGINIEPNFWGYKKFVWARPRDINLNCGISKEEGVLSYYEFAEGAYNTFCKEEIIKNTELQKISNVTTRRLDLIFSEYHVRQIDFLDIDVEGMELNVLDSNDWDVYRPTIVLCEQRMDIEDIIKSDVYIYMMRKGYVAISKYNRTVIYKESSNGK